MKIIYMGTPDFSVGALEALIAAGHDIVAVYTQPPRPAGRGQQERVTAVHACARQYDIPVYHPLNLKDPADQQAFAALGADIAVVAAYGLILPKVILDAPRLGCLNIHASLLPRWRGAAPIQRAIEAGDTETGVTIMQMDVGLDTGDMLLKENLAITNTTTASSLHDDLAALGARMIVDAIALADVGKLQPEQQPEDGVTYAHKIDKAEGAIDWSLPAADLERRMRALSPFPGMFTEREGKRLKVLRAELQNGSGDPGMTLDDQGLVACGKGALRLVIVQPAGKKAMDMDAWLRGKPMPAGTRLGAR